MHAPLDRLTNMEELLQLVLDLDLDHYLVVIYALLERIQGQEQPLVTPAVLDIIQE